MQNNNENKNNIIPNTDPVEMTDINNTEIENNPIKSDIDNNVNNYPDEEEIENLNIDEEREKNDRQSNANNENVEIDEVRPSTMEPPMAIFDTLNINDAFKNFNVSTKNSTIFKDYKDIIKEFGDNFKKFREQKKATTESTKENFQQFLNNYYMAGLSQVIIDQRKLPLNERMPLSDLAQSYNSVMEAVYNEAKNNGAIKDEFDEYVFANATPEDLKKQIGDTVNGLKLTGEEKKWYTNQVNQYNEMIDVYNNEYYLPLKEEINRKNEQKEKEEAERELEVAPPAFEQNNDLDRAIEVFNAKIGGSSIFSNKKDLIKEINTNFKKYKEMQKESGIDEKEVRGLFKNDFLDKLYLADLKKISEEQAKLDPEERLGPSDLLTAYNEVTNKIYEALSKDNFIEPNSKGYSYGGLTPKEITDTLTEGYTAGGIDGKDEEFLNSISEVGKDVELYNKPLEDSLPSLSEIQKDNKDEENKDIDDVPTDVSKETKEAKAEYNFEKDFLNELKAFEQITHIHIEPDQIKEEFDRMRNIPKEANVTDKEVSDKVLESAYNQFYLTNLSNAIFTNTLNVSNGVSFTSPQQAANSFNKLMLAIDIEAKKAGIIKNDYDRNNQETVSAEQTYAETLRYSQTPSDRKEAEQAYNRARIIQGKHAEEGLHKQILKMNKELGTKFSSKGIIDHLAKKFNECDSKDLNDMKREFPGKYKEFLQQAYTNMLSKMDMNDGKTMSEKSKAFDEFTQKLENQLKQKGYLDPSYRHEFNGGLNPEFIKKAQLDELQKRPQTTQQEAEKNINEKEMSEIRKDMEELVKKVPELKEDGPGTIEAYTTVNYLRALDKRHGARSFFNKLAHPIENFREWRTLNVIQDKFEEKGYDRQKLEQMIKNQLSPDQDPISKNRKKEMDAIEKEHDSATNISEAEKNTEKILEDVKVMDFKKKIEVPECDTREEISHPNNASKETPKLESDLEKKKEDTLGKK